LALIEAALAVAAVTFLAIQMPARRAIRTDPMTVLRSE
jgi:ABC-type lipoprotein release transport system permease subunit